jgi:hypothetical protein
MAWSPRQFRSPGGLDRSPAPDVGQEVIAGHPDTPTVEVPAASADIHDLVGLRAVCDALAGR